MNQEFTENELKEEIWKSLENDNRYEFSNLGRIRHTKRPERIFLGDIPKTGYRRWRFGKNGKYIPVHRIIASLFHKEYIPTWDVHHKDGNKLNNRISNLQPICHVQHAIDHASRGENHVKFKSPIGIFKLNGELSMISRGQNELINLGFNKSIPYAIANKKPERKTHKGFTFRWLNNVENYQIGNIYNLEEL